jgi:hypothetical protein
VAVLAAVATVICNKGDPSCHSNTQDIILATIIGLGVLVAVCGTIWFHWSKRRRERFHS